MMISNNYLLQAIKIIGSRTKLVNLLAISRQRLNGWLNNHKSMGLEYALAISHFTQGKITIEHLVPEKAKLLKAFNISFKFQSDYLLPQLIPIDHLVNKVDTIKHIEEIILLAKDIHLQGLLRPIAIDENKQVIFGNKRLKAYELLHKKTIAAYVLPLANLLNNPKASAELVERFSMEERIALGLALEKRFTSPYSCRSKKDQESFSALAAFHPLREVIAKSIGFSNYFTYEQAKKLLQRSHPSLLGAVNKKPLSDALRLNKHSIAQQMAVLEEKTKPSFYKRGDI